MYGLEGKCVVISGASGGVGSASASLFAIEAKAKVALIARRNTDALAESITNAGGTAQSFQADVRDETGLESVFRQITESFGPVQSLLNVAGSCEFYGLDEEPAAKVRFHKERWDRIVSINGEGLARLIGLAVESMPRGGSIVNVASTAGRYGAEAAVSEYSFSKAGVIGLTMAHAKILGAKGIRVNAVAPGPIEGTEMLAGAGAEAIEMLKSQARLGKICKADDIAKINLFLASEMSSVMTGTTLDANCGQYISY